MKMLTAKDVYKILDSHLSEKVLEDDVRFVSEFLSKLSKKQLLNFSFGLLSIMELYERRK